jgi:hypothetical protein
MQCQHQKRDGKRCRAAALTGQTRCAMHAQPGRAAELGSKGGRRRAVISSPGDLKEFGTPKTAADLRELLAESIIEIRAGKLDPRIANALGYLGASYLRALEAPDVESRLSALEMAQLTQERAILQSNPPNSEAREGR